jgi:hypothetical protein
MMPHTALDLTALPVEVAVALAGRDLDHLFAAERKALESSLIADGVNRCQVDGMLEDQRDRFLSWRAQELSELRDWLMDDNRKIH